MSSININIKNLDVTLKKFEVATEKIGKIVTNELDAYGLRVVEQAKELAPADEGFLRNSISHDSERLKVKISVSANYAAYLEFGTRRFAAEYVGSLPSNWQEFASQFKGGKGGTFAELLLAITEWVHRKGLAGTYSIKTRKRTGNKTVQESEDRQVAYLIARKILIAGIKPHPYLYPAVNNQVPILIERLTNIV